MEVAMTVHTDHVTHDEDAAYDSTMKIIGIVMMVVAIAAMAFWYFS